MDRLRALPRGAAYALMLVLAWAGLSALDSATAARLTLVVDGQPRKLQVHAATVAMALLQGGVKPAAGDMVFPSLASPLPESATIEVRRARWLWLELNGQWRLVGTAASSPAAVLAQAGVQLLPGDQVWVDGLPVADPTLPFAEPPQRLRFQEGLALNLRQGGKRLRVRAAAGTVGEALAQAAGPLYEADLVEPGWEAVLPVASPVQIERSRALILQVEGRALRVRAAADTVGEALARAGVVLQGLDRTEPAEDQPVPADGFIRVIRAREEAVLEQEPLPFPIT